MGSDLIPQQQESLSPEIFSRFINLKVGLSLSGSTTYDLEDLEKVLAGEQLQKGSELVVTARYFVSDVHMPVSRRQEYYGAREGSATYKLGDAKLDLKLIQVEKVDVERANFAQSVAKRCDCLVEKAPNTKRPEGYRAAEYPLTAYWANIDCPECHGKGYVMPRENKAPHARRIWADGTVVLVDELPEPPDIPAGGCPQCGQIRGYHYADCPVKIEAEATQKKAVADAKKAYKQTTGKKAPSCFGSKFCYKSSDQCEAHAECRALVKAAPDLPEDIYGPDDDDELVDAMEAEE